VSDQRPYAALLAKGEDRRQRILDVAQQLLARSGWRNTSLGEIASAAGVSATGLLHHFPSKDQLLHAVLEARDKYDEARANRTGDIIEQIVRVADRFDQAPHLIGTFAVLLVENLQPDAPLRDRLLHRYHVALETVADGIRRGQMAGRYRTDIDPTCKAVEVIAFINGMETSWLLDPSVPLAQVFQEYAQSLELQLARPVPPD
jgi:AcrR family transcriptional regulator